MTYSLSQASYEKLKGVHPELVKVVERAIKLTSCDFRVTCGMRTKTEQEILYKSGASKTMNSNHLLQWDGYAHAVDVVALLPGGKVSWDFPLYVTISDAFTAAAAELGVEIEWGGSWPRFRDGPHFQLSKKYRQKP